MRGRKRLFLILAMLLVLIYLVVTSVFRGGKEELTIVPIEEIFEDSLGAKQYEGEVVKTEGRIFAGWGSSGEMLLGRIGESPTRVIEVFLVGSETRLEKQWNEVIRMRIDVIAVEGRIYYGGFHGIKLTDARIVRPFLDFWAIFELIPSILASVVFCVSLGLLHVMRRKILVK